MSPIDLQASLHIDGIWQIQEIDSNNRRLSSGALLLNQAGTENDLWFVCVDTHPEQTQAVEELVRKIYAASDRPKEAKTNKDSVDILASNFRQACNLQTAPRERLPKPLRHAKNVLAFTNKTPAVL